MKPAVESSSPREGSPSREAIWTLPNQITLLRLILSIVLFALIGLGWYLTSTVLFIVAASTDWIDGYIARKYGLCTQLGRMMDPFVDKIIICGTFIYLATVREGAGESIRLESGVTAWMAVIVVGRELLVTALRSFLEQQGADFSASLSGKLKMVLQCAAAAVALFCVHWQSAHGPLPVWLIWTRDGLLWGAVALTVFSGVIYVLAAMRLMRTLG